MPNLVEVRRIINAAALRNDELDRIDRSVGLAAPGDVDDGMLARTVHAALETALMLEDWGIVAEAAAMVRERWVAKR